MTMINEGCRDRMRKMYQHALELGNKTHGRVFDKGTQLFHGDADAVKFMDFAMSPTCRAIAETIENTEEFDNSYVSMATGHRFKFQLPGLEGAQGRLMVVLKKPMPSTTSYQSDGDLPVLTGFPPWIAQQLIDTYALTHFDKRRMKFAMDFFDEFLPKPLESQQKKPDSYKYVHPDERGRTTLRSIARDWPLLLRTAPSEYRSKLGPRSHSTKNQQLSRHEEVWVPVINEWLASGLILKKAMEFHAKTAPPGVYINI